MDAVVKDYEWNYKDRIRHGGKKKQLLEKFGTTCQMCLNDTEEHKLHAHHLIKGNHDFQILVCNSCHGKLHGRVDPFGNRNNVSKEEIVEALNKFPTAQKAADALGISKHGLYYKRKKYGLLESKCSFCGNLFQPRKESLRHYCSQECQKQGKLQKLHERQKRYHGKKLENDKRYYLLNREENLKKQKEYALKNKERLLQYRREYYQKHKR